SCRIGVSCDSGAVRSTTSIVPAATASASWASSVIPRTVLPARRLVSRGAALFPRPAGILTDTKAYEHKADDSPGRYRGARRGGGRDGVRLLARERRGRGDELAVDGSDLVRDGIGRRRAPR